MENRTTEKQKAFRPKRPVKRMPNQQELLAQKKANWSMRRICIICGFSHRG
ncbi:hypothetical protein ABQE36_19460 [Enterococcus avium]